MNNVRTEVVYEASIINKIFLSQNQHLKTNRFSHTLKQMIEQAELSLLAGMYEVKVALPGFMIQQQRFSNRFV